MTRVCDYDNSRYRQEFWEGQGREYEDLAERKALRALLPRRGDRLVEIGAGFGRLTSLYEAYRQVVLVDYARTQLEEAQRFLPDPGRYTLVVADIYNLPFVADLFDAVTMVRVMHHLADVPTALAELHRVCRPQGTAVLEFANKRNLKSIVRWLLRRQTWSPFDRQPVEFVDMHFDFHPAWMSAVFRASGWQVDARRSVSMFRVPLLKRVVPANRLASVDGLLQPAGSGLPLSPSVFVRARAEKPPSPQGPPATIFRCPACHEVDLVRHPQALVCATCHREWPTEGGIYDFRPS